MLYKILHAITGRDYVQWSNLADSGVSAVHIDGNGKPYYWRYTTSKVLDKILDRDDVVWLTCPPSKYLPEYEQTKATS